MQNPAIETEKEAVTALRRAFEADGRRIRRGIILAAGIGALSGSGAALSYALFTARFQVIAVGTLGVVCGLAALALAGQAVIAVNLFVAKRKLGR